MTTQPMISFAGYIDNIEAKNKELREEIAFLKKKIDNKNLWIEDLTKKLVDKNDYINVQRVIISGYTK